jgi:hypothetical protein
MVLFAVAGGSQMAGKKYQKWSEACFLSEKFTNCTSVFIKAGPFQTRQKMFLLHETT